jgi:hypothetical protein
VEQQLKSAYTLLSEKCQGSIRNNSSILIKIKHANPTILIVE